MLFPQLNRAATSPDLFILFHFYLFLFSIFYIVTLFIYLFFAETRCPVFVTQVFVTQDIKEIYLFNAVNCFIHINAVSVRI